MPGAWDEARRGAVAEHFDDPRLLRALDRYATTWTSMAHEACKATRVRGELSEEVLDARTVCLDTRRHSLAATTQMLRRGEVSELSAALDLVYALPDPAPCENLRLLRYLDSPDPDPATRRELEELEQALWRAHALMQTGRGAEATDILARTTPRIDALGHRPLQAQAQRIRAVLASEEDIDRSASLQRDAYRLAMVSHADDTAAELALSLAQTEAFDRGDPETSALWLELAESHAERSALEIQHALAFTRGAVSLAAGDCETAIAQFETAARAGDGRWTGASVVGPAYANIASCHLQEGRPDLAAEPLGKAIEMLEEAYGPDDQRTLDNVANAAAAHRLQGDLAAAERDLEAVLVRQERALGRSHPSVAVTLMSLAAVMRDTDRAGRARELDERALEIREQVFGMKSTKTASVLRALADDARRLEEPGRAVVLRDQAVTILEATVGTEHPSAREARAELEADRAAQVEAP